MFTTRSTTLREWHPDDWAPDVALHLAEHAVEIYRTGTDYAASTRRAGFTGSAFIESGPAQVGLSWDDESIVISPRGSSEGKDWLNDLSLWRRSWSPFLPSGARYHAGFRSQLKRISEPLAKRLMMEDAVISAPPDGVPRNVHNKREHVGGSREVYVTGHSLGAAMVPGLVARLAHSGIYPRAAMMFASPRVGNERFSQFYEQLGVPTWSVVNVEGGEQDLVTRVPKRGWGYRHVGRRVILEAGVTLFGDEAWQLHRAANPTAVADSWRVITKNLRAARAHSGDLVLNSLRERQAA